MNENNFIQATNEGRNEFWRYLITLVRIVTGIHPVLIGMLGKGFFRKGLFAVLMLATLLSACTPAANTPSSGTSEPALALEDCWLKGPTTIQVKAKCGTLRVLEDPAANTGRQIELNVAVVRAVSRDPAPDPLFLLAGGPGQAATEAFLPVIAALERVRFKRDLVMVDQRGTGRSNPLDCESPTEGSDRRAGEDIPLEEQLAWIDSCKQVLDINPNLYTTETAMHDLDQVREALGYEQINLLGVSYGTRAALSYLRLYPQHVRSLILDGVVPPGWVLGSSTGPDSQQALTAIIERCAADEDCHSAFPRLQDDFNDMMASLREQPAELTVPHPTSGKATPMVFDVRTAGAVIRMMSYSDLLAALLPMAIHAAAEGDYQLLAGQYLMLSEQLDAGVSMGMYYSVVCAEDEPGLPDVFEGGSYFETRPEEVHAACEHWMSEPSQPLVSPQTSNVPVLLISGAADPVTPPQNGEEVARLLPNSLHLVLDGLGHNNFYVGCVPSLLKEFLESASPTGIDTACVESIQPEPFFVSPVGPAP